MSYIIDRRESGNKKSAENSQRFKERYKKYIQKAVRKAIDEGSIKDLASDNGEGVNIVVDRDDMEEPQIVNDGNTGKRNDVYTGNKEFLKGQKIPNPKGGGQGQGGSGEGSGNSDEVSEEEFVFQINHKEFMDYLFQELELPELVKKSLAKTKQVGIKKQGCSKYGIHSNLDIEKSFEQSMGRKMALRGMYNNKIKKLNEDEDTEDNEKAKLLAELEKKKTNVSFFDESDLRYKVNVPIKKPTTSAVMFCLMDVSGSVSAFQKDLSKRFYVLLYLFLKKNYEDIDVRFIRYTTEAKDVDENEFFYSKETGGTMASSALKLTSDIIKNEYPTDEWNIYIAHTSDGDNWQDDNEEVINILNKDIIEKVQYYTYVEIKNAQRQSDLRGLYEDFASKTPKVRTADINDTRGVYKALEFLFSKKGAK